jgi:hypothetical protein
MAWKEPMSNPVMQDFDLIGGHSCVAGRNCLLLNTTDWKKLYISGAAALEALASSESW